jgi:hypothetical protein
LELLSGISVYGETQLIIVRCLDRHYAKKRITDVQLLFICPVSTETRRGRFGPRILCMKIEIRPHRNRIRLRNSNTSSRQKRGNTTFIANGSAKNGVIYYNFTSATLEPAVNEDYVFSNTSTILKNVGSTIGSTRTLNRRRHSLGAWFRSSLAVVRSPASSPASTRSELESAAAVERL